MMTLPLSDKKIFIELDLLSALVEEYKDEYYPIKTPSLVDIMKLRMYEMGLSQAKLSELLESVLPVSVIILLAEANQP